MRYVKDFEVVIRTKNADPFITTCDIFVAIESDYAELKDSGAFSRNKIIAAYGMPPEALLGIHFIDNIRAIKVSFLKTAHRKYIASGDLEDVDLFGTQQHVPLQFLVVPEKDGV
jgi:Domain of unknown function (DUF4387)